MRAFHPVVPPYDNDGLGSSILNPEPRVSWSWCANKECGARQKARSHASERNILLRKLYVPQSRHQNSMLGQTDPNAYPEKRHLRQVNAGHLETSSPLVNQSR